MLRNCLAYACVAVFVSAASAQAPKPIRLWLSPAKPPTPALRYQLLPDARLTISGDAAPLYKQVIELLKTKPFNEQEGRIYFTWSKWPLERFPNDVVRKLLTDYGDVFKLLDKAACCDHCDWGMRERLREKGLATLLPELSPLRNCGALLAVRARLEMAESRFDRAANTLRTGFALARHTGETEVPIGLLVGLAIAGTDMQQQVDAFVGAPDAPNLYYALTDLPAPLVSPRKAFEGTRLELYGTFPGLAEIAMNLNARNLSEEQLAAMMKTYDVWKRFEGFSDPRLYYPERVLLARNIQQKHAVAKQALINAGRPRDKVEAMPPIQVAFLHALLEYDARVDEMLACQQLPYWEMADRLKRLSQPDRFAVPRTSLPTETKERLLREKDPNAPAIPLATLLFPRMDKVKFACVRTDRKIALLRTVEAIRFYAAMHDNKLPPTLIDIKEVPIPLDPVTGRSFEYRLDDNTATLRAPAPPKEMPNASNSVVYELRMRK